MIISASSPITFDKTMMESKISSNNLASEMDDDTEHKVRRVRSAGDSLLLLQARHQKLVTRRKTSHPDLSHQQVSALSMSSSQSTALEGGPQHAHQGGSNAVFHSLKKPPSVIQASAPQTSSPVQSSRIRSSLGMPSRKKPMTLSPMGTRKGKIRVSGSHPDMTPSLSSHQQSSKPSFTGSSSASLGSIQTSSSADSSLVSQLNSKVVMQVAQRSNGGTIKAVLAKLRETYVNPPSPPGDKPIEKASSAAVEDEQQRQDDSFPPSPSADMSLLAQCASADLYYKVIITKYHGISTIIKIMDIYAEHLDIQVYGLSTLADLTNKKLIQENGGVGACIRAMLAFSDSIELQSTGFRMLKMQGSALAKESHPSLRPLHEIVEKAKEMYLTQTGKDGVIFVERFLDTYQIPKEES